MGQIVTAFEHLLGSRKLHVVASCGVRVSPDGAVCFEIFVSPLKSRSVHQIKRIAHRSKFFRGCAASATQTERCGKIYCANYCKGFVLAPAISSQIESLARFCYCAQCSIVAPLAVPIFFAGSIRALRFHFFGPVCMSLATWFSMRSHERRPRPFCALFESMTVSPVTVMTFWCPATYGSRS